MAGLVLPIPILCQYFRHPYAGRRQECGKSDSDSDKVKDHRKSKPNLSDNADSEKLRRPGLRSSFFLVIYIGSVIHFIMMLKSPSSPSPTRLITSFVVTYGAIIAFTHFWKTDQM